MILKRLNLALKALLYKRAIVIYDNLSTTHAEAVNYSDEEMMEVLTTYKWEDGDNS